ncbi:uncharacterized protein TM35_000501330 [Trypanosoma theileri]|uniref:Titin n=1 Tax=Trypanosoma theileri TaxID=67003 RepID=A0A1X0NIR9_9TRYP|nr:uncharacterized protein TM35_000501330 [Trypanosoma theileri]ORC84079.1 hypothetical protein TM35_000501330 [Trypanosoma theileri]
MVMMRYVLCILALLLSCACVHVLAEEVPAADLSDQVPDTESETKCLEGQTQTPEGACPPTGQLQATQSPKGTPLCTDAPEASANLQTCPEKHEAPPAKVPEVPKEVVPEKKVTGPPPKNPEVHLEQNTSENDSNGQGEEAGRPAGLQGEVGVHGAVIPVVEGEAEDSVDSGHRTTGEKGSGAGDVSGSSSTTQDSPTPASPVDGSSVAAADGQTGNSGSSPTGETTSTQGGEAAEETSSDSPTNSATGSAVGDNAASTENGNTSEGNESTNNQEEVGGNTETTTTTTTTTTTLPPELTNNKKGDADSSSSISSSVWVRVPLLIVVTLACILVC